MNLLGMGPGELLLIAMLGLIVFGPGKLPEIAAQVGRTVRDLRRSTAEMTREFQEAMEPIKEMAEFPTEVRGAVGAAAVMAQQGVAGQDEAPQATTPAPALADTSEWHWEGSESAAKSEPVASSFWDWDAPASPPAETATVQPSAPEPVQATANGAVWQWDEAERAPVATPVSVSSPPPAPSSADSAPAASLNGAASPAEVADKAPTDHNRAEPVASDVALVGDSATAPAADKPGRRKKTAPAEGPG